jgi:hypothetical protein
MLDVVNSETSGAWCMVVAVSVMCHVSCVMSHVSCASAVLFARVSVGRVRVG